MFTTTSRDEVSYLGEFGAAVRSAAGARSAAGVVVSSCYKVSSWDGGYASPSKRSVIPDDRAWRSSGARLFPAVYSALLQNVNSITSLPIRCSRDVNQITIIGVNFHGCMQHYYAALLCIS